MVEIYYHPFNPRNPFFQSGGVRVSLDEFLVKDYLWEDQKERKVIGFDMNNPLYSKRIVDFMSQAIFTISGHQTSDADIVKIKSLLEKIKHGVRHDEQDIRDKMTAPEFILGTLPYVFTGFKLDRRTDIPHEGQNSLDSIYAICKILCRNESADLSTLLCAHKAKRSIDKHALIERLNFEDVQIALNLLGGIVDNSPVKCAQQVFFQPGGNAQDIQSVFPSLLHRYLVSGRVEEMLAKLEEHLESLKKYLSKSSTYKLSFSAENLGRIYQEAEKQLADLSGRNGSSPLREISEKLVENRLVGLLGQIQDRSEPSSEVYNDDNPVSRQIREIIFIKDNPEKIAKRALHETAVYYAWGVLTGRSEGIGVGFEIDHDKYQTLAWNEGWKKESNVTQQTPPIESPLIYARKSRKDEGSKYLKGISLRESWR